MKTKLLLLTLLLTLTFVLTACSSFDNKRFEADSNTCFYAKDIQECMRAKGWYK